MTEQQPVTEPSEHERRSLGSTIAFGWVHVSTVPPSKALRQTEWRLSNVDVTRDAPDFCKPLLDALQPPRPVRFHRDEQAAENAARALTRAIDGLLRQVAAQADAVTAALDGFQRITYKEEALRDARGRGRR